MSSQKKADKKSWPAVSRRVCRRLLLAPRNNNNQHRDGEESIYVWDDDLIAGSITSDKSMKRTCSIYMYCTHSTLYPPIFIFNCVFMYRTFIGAPPMVRSDVMFSAKQQNLPTCTTIASRESAGSILPKVYSAIL